MNLDQIPTFLRQYRGWLVWKAIDKGGAKPIKMPFYITGQPRKGEQGSLEDRTQLATFDDALAAYNSGEYKGLGFAMLPDWGLTALDFDKCVVDGKVLPEVLELVEGLYVELSPSGTGVRAFTQGDYGNHKSHADKWGWGFETFHNKGFVTITGNTLPISKESIIPPPDTYERLKTICKVRFTKPELATTPFNHIRMGLTNEQIQQILTGVNPDVDYGDWLQAGMAIHHETGGNGFALWDEWSAKGSKYPGQPELAAKWKGFGKSADRLVTIGSLAKLAEVNLAELQATGKPANRKFNLLHVSDFIKRPPPTWLVKGLLPAKGIGMLYGPSGAGKSFWMLALMMAIAQGKPWRNLKVKGGRVVYIAAEGEAGLVNRCKAMAQQHGLDLNDIDLLLLPDNPNFFTGGDAAILTEAIRAAGGAAVVVIDTLAQTTAGANENAGEDMGKVFETLQIMQRTLDCLVLLVHHAGKDSSKGARGWSGMRAALDVEIEVTKTPTGHLAKITKQKDGADGAVYPFKLVPVTLGLDDDGDVVSSCVVAHVDDAPVPVKPKGKLKIAIWEAILAGEVTTIEDIAPSLEELYGKGKTPRADSIRRALDNMVERGFIIERAGAITLPQSHNSSQMGVCGDVTKPEPTSTTTTTPYRGVDVKSGEVEDD